ncbi:motility protein A [Arthrobacter frigidicola]|nr:motility protein A [Arthrobacter frigidicola]
MDPATLIGLLLAFGSLYAMIFMEGAHVSSLLLPAPMILVLGATIAIGIASSTIKDVIQAVKSLPKAFRGRTDSPQESVDQIIRFAEKARADGLLALEAEAAETDDPFMKNGLQNIADGTDGEDLRILLEDEISTRRKANHAVSKFFNSLGGYAPTVGIVGTVVSLTHVLENLSNPEELGHMIAAAFVATLWGLLSANFIWLPIGARLARLSELELEQMNLQMEGLLAVQEGAQPILLGERLTAMIPPHKRGGKRKEGPPTASDLEAAA